MSTRTTVLKIGGSVLTGPQAYRRVSSHIGTRLCTAPGERIVAVVSAELGVTDRLLATATGIVEQPDARTLDLLWSTGETRSAALLALSLQALGVRVTVANVHQAGLSSIARGSMQVNPLRLQALLADHDVVVVPGFFARGGGDSLRSLGRGGSDLTAVLLAAGLGAASCELLKDVPGFFTQDPKRSPDARPIPRLSFTHALAMADDGCELVQRQAIEAARVHALPLHVRAIGHAAGTRIHDNADDL
jgi:aspartate kinase